MPPNKKRSVEDLLRAAVTQSAAERLAASLPPLSAEPLLAAWRKRQAASASEPVPFPTAPEKLALAARRGQKLSPASKQKLADALRTLRDKKPPR